MTSAIKSDTMERHAPEEEEFFRAGKIIANPPPGEEVVVTGMTGCFPNADDVHQYHHNLLNKIDMITDDNSRWDLQHPEIPHRSGKVRLVEKFDAGFFGVSLREAEMMDPMGRRLLEHAVEAIMDAGYNVEQMKGSNIGVFIGTCYSETEKVLFYDRLESPSYVITGCERSMQAQRISHFLGLEGPSNTFDTACSSSMYAFEHAYRAIRTGRCEAALVGGANLCFHPFMTLQFSRLGVLSPDGKCKCFEADADGYVRSETTAMVFLQKAKDAKRIYAQVIYAKLNCDGFKEQGITYPSGPMQKQLLKDLYHECNVDPTTVDYLEAHATGTQVGDPEEMKAMDEVYCTNRKTPLLVGSVKSSVGHTEPSSALCSIVKVLLGMNNDYLLPNINYKTPRKGIEALEKGRMVVVTDTTPWPKNGSGLVAINNFGFGGANGHILLKKWTKNKINHGMSEDDLPRLICVSGRTEHAVDSILDDIKIRPLDAEFVRLIHDLFGADAPGHPSRGYMVLSKQGEIKRLIFNNIHKQPLCLVFNEPNEKWFRFGKQLLEIPSFSITIWRAHNFLLPYGIDLIDIINTGQASNLTKAIMANVAIQMSIVDIIKTLKLHVDYIVGNSVGELVAAYADGALTHKQTLTSCYLITKCREENQKSTNIYYEVEMEQKYLQAILPNELIISEIKSMTCVITGPIQAMTNFVIELRQKGIVVKQHQNNFLTADTRSKLLNYLEEILSKPGERSTRWLPSTHTQEEGAKYASAKYFIDCLSKPKLFKNIISRLPPSTTMVIVGRKLEECNNLNAIHFLSMEDAPYSILYTLGRIYLLGHTMKLETLYPTVQFPVSSGTPIISPLIKWNHNTDWYTAFYNYQRKISTIGNTDVAISLKTTEWDFLVGHNIDGRILFPATGYLVIVWKIFSKLLGEPSVTKVAFENIKFIRATNLPKVEHVRFNININIQTGLFEIINMEQVAVTGRIFIPKTSIDEAPNHHSLVEQEDTISYSTKDVYKELKLRGYNYSGEFRAITKCNLSATKASIKWSDNWIAFMDNMLQVKILQEDTRGLYVPTGIDRLTIDPDVHKKYVDNIGEDKNLAVYADKTTDIIKSGGIEVRGLSATSIPRKKVLGVPVLEVYKFVPFECKLSTEESIRVQIQILLENTVGIKLRIVEVLDEATEDDLGPLGPIVSNVLNDLPLIQPQIVVFSSKSMEVSNVLVEDKKLSAESNSCNVVIVSRFFDRQEIKADVLKALKSNGKILSRENQTFNSAEAHDMEFAIISIYDTGKEKLVLLQRHVETVLPNAIEISNDTKLDWLPKLQNILKKGEGILVYAQNSPANGILGFINCLRREANAENIKCVFLQDENQNKFNLNDGFYLKQIRKGLAVNVFKDGEWGTYRHLKLAKDVFVGKEHVFNNVTVKGDLTSLRWLEGPLKSTSILPLEHELVKIYYASLNFRDVMTATGRISNDIITRNRLEQYNLQGLEFVGRDQIGRRIMGMVRSGSLASIVKADSNLLYEIPVGVSMEEAATIPIVYGTVLHAFILIANIQRGQSVLIHAGTGGIGQAAINVAIHYACNIFTTVGTQEKREFIRKKFPQIPECQIGNSRHTSFEDMVFKETNGRGVDIVLNSLSEEKLKASIRCLAPGGKFLEIGKFDLSNNNFVSLDDFTQGRSFHGVMADAFLEGTPAMRRRLGNLILTGMKEGYVKPLNRTIFNMDQIEEAFRYMAGGKHTGKVIIKIHDEESRSDIQPKTQLFNGLPRFYGSPDKCYIISGGLGGFGLELVDWLVTRGVMRVILVSRAGIQNGYQASRLRIWNSYGVIAKISTDDITTMEGCTALIKEANEIGSVEGIFNLAAVLKDGIMDNQNEDSFMTSLLPKSVATRNFDVVSREMCPNLKYFVVFSSVSCGRGNVGQTNYGMANSIMERICEQRKKDGFPSLAIQWGAIGEVGLVADMHELQIDMEIGGTLQQRVGSCLEVMDVFLSQDEAVVASMVVAEKRSAADNANNVMETVKIILGFRDWKTVAFHSSLSELGMDSMMAVEIKQTLEREYDLVLSAQDLRSLTVARLQELAEQNTTEVENSKRDERKIKPKPTYLFRDVIEEKTSTEPIIKMETLVKKNTLAPKVFLLPGIEGMAMVMEPLALNLTCEALCLQYTYKAEPECTIEALAKFLLKEIYKNLPSAAPFTIVAYSYGCVPALEVASHLEAEGRMGRIILIDGSPAMIKELAKLHIPEQQTDLSIETSVLSNLMQMYVSLDIVKQYEIEIYKYETFEDRIKFFLSKLPDGIPMSDEFKRIICLVANARFKSAINYQPKFPKLKSPVTLYKPTVETIEGFDNDYKLQELCQNPVELGIFEGNHVTILKNPQLANAINRIVDTSAVYLKRDILTKNPENVILKEDRDKWIE